MGCRLRRRKYTKPCMIAMYTNLKEKVLDPFLENENFRRAIKDYNEEDFKTYDKRIRGDVTYLIKNLVQKKQLYGAGRQRSMHICH